MGSDDSLAGLAVQELVSALIDLLSAEEVLACLPEEEVIEIKNLCCNILAHLMDVIPKAADTVVMAVPLLITTMSCSFVGDILERIINVLEQVSRRNGRQVLLYGGVTVSLNSRSIMARPGHQHRLVLVACPYHKAYEAIMIYDQFKFTYFKVHSAKSTGNFKGYLHFLV